MQDVTQYTRCPQCKTVFKVSEKMLSMAHGKVRCGACLEVFQANDYMLKPRVKEETESNIPQNQTAEMPASQSKDSLAIDEERTEPEVKIDDINEPDFFDEEPHYSADISDAINEVEIPEEKQEPAFSVPVDIDSPEDDDQGLNTFDEPLTSQQEILESNHNESGFAEFDDQEFDNTAEDAVDIDFELETSSEVDSIRINEEAESIEVSAASVDPEVTYEETQVEEEQSNELELISEKENYTESERFESKSNSADLVEFEDELGLDEPELSETELDDSENIEMDADYLSDTLTNQINESDVEPDPLDEFEERVEQKKTGLRNGIIATTALILLTILAVQFWSNRQTLAWDKTWSSTTHAICSALPCELKPRKDTSKIRVIQRLVTPSEQSDNLLDIKISMTNDASFDQPYPRISIQFSNSLGEQVAVKHFEVKEYFPENNGQLMRAGSEVHISFSTELPHPDALGFEFVFK
ncbi:DUF3426 domain-containing protein [Aliikangiella sp. IMCC44359]|uniref:DUF3426 domain-containing protein n=1 Tax=Aliikangiella sp. IMCC44359 TaxID=3459125 RepID=UPI00403B104A